MAIVLSRQSAAKADGALHGITGLLPYAAILAVALILRSVVGGITDVSWQITLSEKILDGQRLYVDLLEVNPPASTFLYLPAVALSRALRLSPEFLIDLQTLLAACLSVIAAGRILARAPQLVVNLRAAGIIVLAVLTLLPLHTFAQREHFALIAMVPLLAAAAVRAAGVVPLRWQAIAAGLCGGAMISIKPHFALAIVLVYAVAAMHRRSIRPFFALESWIAAAVTLLYAAIVAVFYPAFLTDMMPLLAALYLPARRSLTNPMFIMPIALYGAAFAVMIALDRRMLRDIVFQVVFAASVGFGAAYLIQGKGWPYQALPMLALMVIACAAVVQAARAASPFKQVATLAELIVVTASAAVWLQISVDTRAVAAEVRRVADRPSVVVISGDIAHGHPLTRDVGGHWLSAVCSLWIMDNAMLLEEAGRIPAAAKERIAAYVAADRARLIADIRDGKPDIILIREADLAWARWASADPAVTAQLASYTKLKTVDGITIYRRNT